MSDQPLTEQQRFPLLTDAGREMLRRLKQHPHGPRFNYPCGERLTASGLEQVREYADQLASQRTGWRHGEVPGWVNNFIERCQRDVPIYRDRIYRSGEFFDLPTIDRSDIRREPWAFVPDTADVSELIVYRTSGTSGNYLPIPSHPVAPNCYLPLMQTALANRNVKIEGGNRVSIIHVANQVQTYTLATVMSYFDSAGFAKVNLNPTEWTRPNDGQKFLDDCDPEIYTGDPFAFEQLAKTGLQTQPKALISSATTLLPGELATLESQFGCPVLDMYALNEAGPVAVSCEGGHEILPHNLYVEILDEAGRTLAPGETGEITVTGGVNPNLPLIRYRTGDFAALNFDHPIPRLTGFTGRRPVLFEGESRRVVNSIDVTVALYKIPLPFFSLHQSENGDLRFRTRCDATTQSRLERTLHGLFGSKQQITFEQIPPGETWDGKWIQYSSDLME